MSEIASVQLDWSAEDAMAATENALQLNPARGWADPTLPVFQWSALHELERERTEFERTGDGYYVLRALRRCCNHDLVAPNWLALAFVRAFDTVNNVRAGSWDEVFGRPFPKGVHLARLHEQRHKSGLVYWRVKQLRDSGLPLEENLFKTVGKEFQIGKTKASEYYYRWEAFFDSAKN